MVISDYISDVLYEIGGIKGGTLHRMVAEALRKDGKVPSKEQWLEFVDYTSDGLCPLECQNDFPETAKVLMDIFIPE